MPRSSEDSVPLALVPRQRDASQRLPHPDDEPVILLPLPHRRRRREKLQRLRRQRHRKAQSARHVRHQVQVLHEDIHRRTRRIVAGQHPRAWEGQPNQPWREQIAAEETRREGGDFGYGMRNPASGALGRYQLTRIALIEAGWLGRDGRWTQRARDAGVATDAEFLANPAAQEAALNAVLSSNEDQLRRNGATRSIGREVPGLRGGNVPITESGLAAAAHREGPGAVRRYLEHREANRPVPPSVQGRGNLSVFNEVERRLREFAGTPYERVSR